ncbi:MAG: hypothetical protein NZ455_04820 [Bacteroidia bacterium]|nr:hypothetical protein [Bacteroidia bacterium]MDW8346213.1 hypothetical protein [Bacteroidia bacterium]
MKTWKKIILWLCAFIFFWIIEHRIFIQDKSTRKYRTTATTVLNKPTGTYTLENINNIHATPSGILNILYVFQYNSQILESKVNTQKGKRLIKDYILETVDKKEISYLEDNYHFDTYSQAERQKQIAFMLLQGRLYFTFDRIDELMYVHIHFVHSDTMFAREYIHLNIRKYNEVIQNRKIIIFRDKYAMIDEDLHKTESKIEDILREIAIHKDTRQRLVKETGLLDLNRFYRNRDIEDDMLYRKRQSAEVVYSLNIGDVKQLFVTNTATFKDNTRYDYVIKNYIILTSLIYSFLTVFCISFIHKKSKIFREWLVKQNIS